MFEVDLIVFVLAILVVLGSAVVAGLAAGLFGIGGGIILVPGLTDMMMLLGVPVEEAIRTAVGTSLATVVVTSVRSAHAHYKKGSFSWQVARDWAPFIIIGALCGTALGSQGSRELFRFLFLFLGPIIAFNMAFGRKDWSGVHIPLRRYLQPLSGSLVGFFSVMMGLGVGGLGVPTITLFGVELRRAIGTAAVLGLCTSIPGVCGFMYSGIVHEAQIAGPATGYISWLGFALIVPVTLWLAPLGVKLNHLMSLDLLRRAFAVLTIVNVVRLGLTI